jgi:hypothetical protein
MKQQKTQIMKFLMKQDFSLLKFSSFLIALLLMSTFAMNAQCVTSTDCARDGIENGIDLDNDTNGLLDTQEVSVVHTSKSFLQQ